MDKIIGELLKTPWGKNFVGGIFICSFSIMMVLGYYCSFLVEKVQSIENAKALEAKEHTTQVERLMREHLQALQSLLARQDQIEQKIKKRR